MYPLAHLGFAAGMARLATGRSGFSLRVFFLVGLGAGLPDLVDKGAGLLAGLDLVVGHSLAFAGLWIVTGMFLGLEPDGSFSMDPAPTLVGAGCLSHLLLDLPGLTTLGWPFTNTVPPSAGSELTFAAILTGLKANPGLVAGEIAGGIVLVFLGFEAARHPIEDPAPPRLESQTASVDDARPETISVAICTNGRTAHVLRLVEALGRQTKLPDEIVVVDGDPDVDLEKRLEHRDEVRYIRSADDSGLTQARNLAIDETSGDVCLFLDDDTIPEPSLVETLLETYGDQPRIGGAGGIPVESTPPSWFRRCLLLFFLRGPFAHPASFYHEDGSSAPFQVRRLSGAIQSYRREVLERFRFDENLVRYCPGEDRDFSYRVSREFPLILVPEARAHHDVEGWGSQTLEERFRTKVLSYSYHYLKNLHGGISETAAYAWLLTGILGEAVLYTIKEFSFDPILGVSQGVQALLGDMAGAGGVIEQDPRRVSVETTAVR